MKHGKADPCMFAEHDSVGGARGCSIPTVVSLTGCCAPSRVVDARPKIENAARAIATLRTDVRRSITASPPGSTEVQPSYACTPGTALRSGSPLAIFHG